MRAGIWVCIECMIGRLHGYLCFVMFPGERKEKRKDSAWDSGGETSNRVSVRRRVDSVTPVSNLPVAAAEANQQKGVRTNVVK